MPTNTYVALDKITVGTAVSSVTFSSIPQTYTDLVIVAATTSTVAATNFTLRFGNGSVDTASNYSAIRLVGNGSSASSGTNSGTVLNFGDIGNPNTPAVNIIHIMNYTNTTTFKTILGRANTVDIQLQALVGLWRKTPEAINIITIGTGSNNFAVGSTFSLYGIASSGAGAKATGGIVTSDANYYYHTFLASGTFTPTQSLTADCLVVAGGGGGAARSGAGGGGAGGYRESTGLSLTATGYTVTVGAGGAGGEDDTIPYSGSNGTDSVFSSITSTGGGGGALSSTAASGGSGGGGGRNSGSGGTGNTPSTSPSQGNNGGTSGTGLGGGGGGGAGAVGGNGGTTDGGAGGAGVASSISGSSVTRAGGGGGSGEDGTGAGGAGGAGGGGAGASVSGGSGGSGVSGTANTGGGGGGGAYSGGASVVGGSGGSGIVIVRYAK